MLFGDDPGQYRRFFYEVWRKYREGQVLESLEDMVARTIIEHPEYHALIEDATKLDQDFPSESGHGNPFLHMGLHIAIQEQVVADRPAGIRDIYHHLKQRHDDSHEVEHRMAECLAESIWETQRNGTAPDERNYLNHLRRL